MSASLSHSDSGFTLVEMAAVIIIAGLILAAAASAAIPIIREARIVGTQGKIDKISRAIDFYATQNYRVPCPANPNSTVTTQPFGYETGSLANGDQTPDGCTLTNGVVPWRTLGLPRDLAIDAWGNYITYAVSPAFTRDTLLDTPDIPVHAACRTAEWYTAPIIYDNNGGAYPGPSVYTHRNPRKARFCCPYPTNFLPATDLIIDDASGTSQLNYSRSTGNNDNEAALTISPTTAHETASTITPYYINLSTQEIQSNAILDFDKRPTAPVYVLVSHGANGYGAWNINTGARTSTAGATPHEVTNAPLNASPGTSLTFFEVPALDRTNGEKGFDDVVLWRTQDLIFASQGQSCAAP